MSTKHAKKARKPEVASDFKCPVVKLEKMNEEDVEVSESNGHSNNGIEAQPKQIVTRSRSNTPIKRVPNKEAVEEVEPALETIAERNGDEGHKNGQSPELEEMDPLVLNKDEEDAFPELVFEDNSDAELGFEASPNRCTTRRSQSRHIPTPKTPKLVAENGDESTNASTPSVTPVCVEEAHNSEGCFEEAPAEPQEAAKKEESGLMNSSTNSTEDCSTDVIVGGDSTRNIELSLQDSHISEGNSSLNLSQDYRLSARRPIHHLGKEDYRKRAWKNLTSESTHERYESVDRIHGVKRKGHSLSPDRSKRAKPEGNSIFSYIPNPLTHLRNPFSKSDLLSSTPKLMNYKSSETILESTGVSGIGPELEPPANRKWCSIM